MSERRGWRSHPLVQLTLVRYREFIREPEAVFWTFGFPIVVSLALAATHVAVATGVVWAWPHVFQATRLWIWDDYTYHMVYPALWLREHAIAAPTPASAFTMQAWYPLSASVIAAWFMVPFASARGEALAWVSVTGLPCTAVPPSLQMT